MVKTPEATERPAVPACGAESEADGPEWRGTVAAWAWGWVLVEASASGRSSGAWHSCSETCRMLSMLVCTRLACYPVNFY